MNDFLHKLRKGQDYKRTGNDVRYINKSRYYDGNKNGSNDYRGKKNHAGSVRNKSHLTEEIFADIKESIQNIKESQKRLAEAEERRAIADERMADALELLVGTVGPLFGIQSDISEEHKQYPEPVHSNNDDCKASKMKNLVKTASGNDRDRVMDIITVMRSADKTYKEIAECLEKENLPTFSGRGNWHAQTVHRLCRQVCLSD